MKNNDNRFHFPFSAGEADLAAAALQMMTQAYSELESHESAVAAFALRGRMLAHAKACRRFSPSESQFEEEKRRGYTRRPR